MSTAAAGGQLPWWRVDQRPRTWVPIGAFVLFVLTAAGESSSVVCTAAQPCGPDWIGAVLLGLLLASAVAIFVHRWTAALLAVLMTALWLLAEQADPSHAWWVQLGALGYTALCVRVAAAEHREPAAPALTLHVPAPVGARPRLGRGWRLVAAALVLGAGGITWGTIAQQSRVQDQEDGAQLVTGVVTGHVDQTRITVRLDNADTRVDVLDSAAYPVGSTLGFLVDAGGLRQPVSEPYDVTGLLSFAELAAGLALAALLRARGYEAALRRFLREPQPARLVRVINADGIIAVFPFEPADELDPPYLVYPAVGARTADARRPATIAAEGEPTDDEDEAERAPVIATLYGVDRPGHWCAAEVDGVLLTPARPVKAGPGPAAEPESLDEPVDPDELWGDDRVVDFRVRTHQHHPAGGALQALGLGGGLVIVFSRFLTLGTVGLLVLVAVVLAASSEFCWRTLLRPRVRWHGSGLAVVTPFGGFNARWDDVTHIAAARSDVTIMVDGVGGAVVPTRRRLPGWLPERTARELALALRHTRQHSLLGEPPPVPPVHRPAGLYLACAALVPLLVMLIHWAHSA